MSEEDQKREELINKVKGFFKSDSKEENSSDLDQKREELLTTLKEKQNWIVYLLLGIIIWVTSYVRLKSVKNLIDVTTGKHVPMALDPHLFLKYAKYIVEHGSLYAHDVARFVPEGISTIKYVFMSSFIVYVYKIMHFFNPAVTIEYAAIVYPVVTFAGAMVFFFLLVRRLFDDKIALLATLFLTVVPAFLHRTTAGFSDHESLGIMLMFMAMYFYVVGWQQKTNKKSIIYGSLAGIFTGLMGLTWGGWKFLILIISIFILIVYFFDKLETKDTYQYITWVVFFVLTTTTWIPMFSLKVLFGSFTTSIAFLVVFMLLVDLFIFKKDLLKIKQKIKGKVPLSVASFCISIVLGLILVSAALGPTVFIEKSTEITDSLLHPLGNDRWELTVAEQSQPYFTSWVAQFGPSWFNLPAYLILFMVGSILLFFNMVKSHKKKFVMTITYILFLLGFVMSRHSPNSTFNGVNSISIFVYLGSLVAFVLLAIYFYFNAYYKDKGEYHKILKWDKKYIFVFVWFLIMIVAARGAARLLFIFAPITALMASYAVMQFFRMALAVKNKWTKIGIIAVLVLIIASPFAFPSEGIIPNFYKSIDAQASGSGPSYSPQWQHTGKWVRENVPKDAVFGHWWDYGYWVQNGFERATVLDGTNKNRFWNFLMGRHVLTAQSQTEALEVLKAHDTTHFLIVADEIGKYTAYSSIGSNEDHDRYSWISTFSLNEQATEETRNSTILMYQGGYVLDDDFIWEGKAFPRTQAGIGAVFVPMKQLGEGQVEFEQPTAALVQNGQRTDVPLNCIYVNGRMMKFPGKGLPGCFRIIPTLDNNGQLKNIMGAGLFVSGEGVNALWTNL
jgi:asparagine N-glycosylation enzyme membrane subunit Stt3